MDISPIVMTVSLVMAIPILVGVVVFSLLWPPPSLVQPSSSWPRESPFLAVVDASRICDKLAAVFVVAMTASLVVVAISLVVVVVFVLA